MVGSSRSGISEGYPGYKTQFIQYARGRRNVPLLRLSVKLTPWAHSVHVLSNFNNSGLETEDFPPR